MRKYLPFLFIFHAATLFCQRSDRGQYIAYIDLELSNDSISNVLKSLESDYGIKVFFENQWFEGKTATVHAYNEPILNALKLILQNTSYEAFQIKGRSYAIVAKGDSKKTRTVQLNGIVRGSQTGEPIIGASVSIPELGITTITDQLGKYKLVFDAGTYLILARTLEREQLSIVKQIYDNEILDFEIFDTVTELSEVVVTFRKEDYNISGAFAGKVIQSIESIKKLPSLLGEVDISRVIQTLPGVQTVGEGASGFNVRGGAIDQNLILMDNMPIYNSSHLLGYTSIFNPDVINDFEIYKGSMPSKYGGKLSSVVNVSLKKPDDDKFSLSGSLGPVSNKLSLNVPVKSQEMGVLMG
ncbi:MAG: TonB-dependent receptor plug domain-containing protein, partial [Bacteroidota bacterium]